MASLVPLGRPNPTLVMRWLYGALVVACYNMVWTSLTFLLTKAPYGYSEGQIGLFGLVGIGGMLSARSAGRLFDRGHGNAATGAFVCMVLASFALVAMGGHSLFALLAGMVLLDVGVYGLHISNRSEEHTSELQSRQYLVCRLLLDKKKTHLLPLHRALVL